MARARDKGGAVHLVDRDDPARLSLCGKPGPWSAVEVGDLTKKCPDCATSQQVRTNHVGGRAWTGR